MDQQKTNTAIFGVRLDRVRDISVRLAFAILLGSDRFWAGLVVGLPLAFLLASPLHDVFISLAAGLPIGICLWLLWLSDEFVSPRVVVDIDNRTLTKSKPYNLGQYSPIDVADIDHVSIIRFSNTALVKLHYPNLTVSFSKPLSAAIPTSRLDEFESRLRQMSLDVSIREGTPGFPLVDSIYVRILVTPIVILGTLLVVWYLYGSEAFLTNVVVVPAIVMIGTAMYGVVWRYRLRRSNREYSGESH